MFDHGCKTPRRRNNVPHAPLSASASATLARATATSNYLAWWLSALVAQWLSGSGGVLCFWHLAAVATLPHRRHIFPETPHDPITGIRQLPRRLGVAVLLLPLLLAVSTLAIRSFNHSIKHSATVAVFGPVNQSQHCRQLVQFLLLPLQQHQQQQQHQPLCAKIKCCENSFQRLGDMEHVFHEKYAKNL